MDMPLLQPQGRLNSQQRAEFYKQYYQEMIRRGAEGLRNMNVEFGTDDFAGVGPDGAPLVGFPPPDAMVRLQYSSPAPLLLNHRHGLCFFDVVCEDPLVFLGACANGPCLMIQLVDDQVFCVRCYCMWSPVLYVLS